MHKKITTISPGLAKDFDPQYAYKTGEYVLHKNAYWRRKLNALAQGDTTWTEAFWELIPEPLETLSVNVDTTLDRTSANPVRNSAVTTELSKKVDGEVETIYREAQYDLTPHCNLPAYDGSPVYLVVQTEEDLTGNVTVTRWAYSFRSQGLEGFSGSYINSEWTLSPLSATNTDITEDIIIVNATPYGLSMDNLQVTLTLGHGAALGGGHVEQPTFVFASAVQSGTTGSLLSTRNAPKEYELYTLQESIARHAPTPETITVDSTLSSTSTNPVQNKVVKAALDAAQVNSNWTETNTSSKAYILNKPVVYTLPDTEVYDFTGTDALVPLPVSLPIGGSRSFMVTMVISTVDGRTNVGDAFTWSSGQRVFGLACGSQDAIGGVKLESLGMTLTHGYFSENGRSLSVQYSSYSSFSHNMGRNLLATYSYDASQHRIRFFLAHADSPLDYIVSTDRISEAGATYANCTFNKNWTGLWLKSTLKARMFVTFDTAASTNNDTALLEMEQRSLDALAATYGAAPAEAAQLPAMDGAADAGKSGQYARADHVHPHDASKLGVFDHSTSYSDGDAVLFNGVSYRYKSDDTLVTLNKTAPQLVFPGATLADLDDRTLCGHMQGYVNDALSDISFFNRTATPASGSPTSVSYQLQVIDKDNDGYFVKAVYVDFTEQADGVYAQIRDGSSSNYTDALGSFGSEPLSTNTSTNSYIPYGLRLVPSATAFSVNFTHGGNNLDSSSSARCGARDFAVPYSAWKNMAGTNTDTDEHEPETFDGVTVAISGAKGSNRCNALSSGKDLRHGYIDDDAGHSTPTVTITGITYDKYRIVTYMACNSADFLFGPVTMNEVDYSGDSVNATTVKGSLVWGTTGAADKATGLHEGMNYLVSDVTSGSTATIRANRVSLSNPVGRGCIAAIQIVKVPDPSEDPVRWTPDTSVMPGYTTVTVDESLSSTSTNPVQNVVVNAAIQSLNSRVLTCANKTIVNQQLGIETILANAARDLGEYRIPAIPTAGTGGFIVTARINRNGATTFVRASLNWDEARSRWIDGESSAVITVSDGTYMLTLPALENAQTFTFSGNNPTVTLRPDQNDSVIAIIGLGTDTLVKKSELPTSEGSDTPSEVAPLLLSKTWAELKALRDAGSLTPGQQYRITDYVATTVQADTQSANHPFDLIVVADSSNHLNEIARAVLHEVVVTFSDSATYQINDYVSYNSTIYKCTADHTGAWDASHFTAEAPYFYNSKLTAWEIHYCLDNDTSRFAWADTTKGKGVIFRMVDEFYNDVAYDFKGIQMKAYNDTTGLFRFTFDSGNRSSSTDLSLTGQTNSVYQNTIRPTVDMTTKKQTINQNVFLGARCFSNKLDDTCTSNTFSTGCYLNQLGMFCSQNYFNSSCMFNTLRERCTKNTFATSCGGNRLDAFCSSNTFGTRCGSNILSTACMQNTFATNTTDVKLGGNCSSNEIAGKCNSLGINCESNTLAYCEDVKIGNNCTFNTIGDNAKNIVIEAGCATNTIGPDAQCVTLGMECEDNTIGEYCWEVSLGIRAIGNQIGGRCRQITFGTYTSYCYLGSYCQDITTGTACRNFRTGTADNLQNLYCHMVIEPSVHNVYLVCTAARDTPATAMFSNVRIATGVIGSDSTPKVLEVDTPTANITFKPANRQEVSV